MVLRLCSKGCSARAGPRKATKALDLGSGGTQPQHHNIHIARSQLDLGQQRKSNTPPTQLRNALRNCIIASFPITTPAKTIFCTSISNANKPNIHATVFARLAAKLSPSSTNTDHLRSRPTASEMAPKDNKRKGGPENSGQEPKSSFKRTSSFTRRHAPLPRRAVTSVLTPILDPAAQQEEQAEEGEKEPAPKKAKTDAAVPASGASDDHKSAEAAPAPAAPTTTISNRARKRALYSRQRASLRQENFEKVLQDLERGCKLSDSGVTSAQYEMAASLFEMLYDGKDGQSLISEEYLRNAQGLASIAGGCLLFANGFLGGKKSYKDSRVVEALDAVHQHIHDHNLAALESQCNHLLLSTGRSPTSLPSTELCQAVIKAVYSINEEDSFRRTIEQLACGIVVLVVSTTASPLSFEEVVKMLSPSATDPNAMACSAVNTFRAMLYRRDELSEEIDKTIYGGDFEEVKDDYTWALED
ncbi:hypothetical protein BJ508DRAFT_328868 [Ascobolus immersus RN42]|uniref:Uncharacterized protein n=1 Tax=Ascobolus immersus RN42 TaxID=1160509 RepID=A0A3N4I2E5_ASCIM|nr:hypothetical protein BJ508DRAFT_328868 [Ascobolus immersus RN42]